MPPAPVTTNHMEPGPKVTEAWVEQSRSAVGSKIEPAAQTVPPNARIGMGSAVSALLNKSVAEKRAGLAGVGVQKGAPVGEQGGGAEGGAFSRIPSIGRTPSLREAVKRTQEAEKLRQEQEEMKKKVTKVRVSIKYIKHLPKMDTFGKTDAYCITALDNKPFGGQKYKRKSKIQKNSLNPEWSRENYYFDVKNFPEQDVNITVMDWDAGGEDDLIGNVKIPLAPLVEQSVFAETYNVLGHDKLPVTGNDGSHTLIRIELEKDAAPANLEDVNVESLVGDSEEIRTLVTSNWEHSVRSLMFDIENHSQFPVVVTGFEANAGRGKGDGSAAYTIYHAVGRWNVQRCPCCRLSPCKFCKCCCGSCPSGKPDFRCMKCCCRCTPCSAIPAGCCCCGECGPGIELAELCCDGCIPCGTGNLAIPLCLFPVWFPLCCWGCGCCAGEEHGGVAEPGCWMISLCRLNGSTCYRNGVHRHHDDCMCGPETPSGPICRLNCSCCSTVCNCCRNKFYDRRRWTYVTSGWLNLPSDWGSHGLLPSMQHYGRWKEWRDEKWVKSGGGVLIPARQTAAIYIHVAHPTTSSGNHALGVRGPFKRGKQRGDVTDKDAFIKLRTGAVNMHPIPFANSDPVDSSRDGQYYRLRDQHLDQYKVYAFAGKVHYRVLDPKSDPRDCAWLCVSRWGCHWCCEGISSTEQRRG